MKAALVLVCATRLSLSLGAAAASVPRSRWSPFGALRQRVLKRGDSAVALDICRPGNDAFKALGSFVGTDPRGGIFSAAVIPVHMNLTGEQAAASAAGARETRTFIDGSAECSSPSKSIDEPVSRRAICPWKWEFNYNPHRIPSVIYEARCSCDRRSADYSYECEPVLMKIKVLNFSSGCASWEPAEEIVHMGCVAVVVAETDELQSSTPSVTVDRLPNVETL